MIIASVALLAVATTINLAVLVLALPDLRKRWEDWVIR
jgi:hypothetical protein